jgi:uncharacterized protein YndB with AHSA1/START domain
MIKREEDGCWLSHQETIAAHHEDVFASLTTPPGLTRWFPLAAEVDLREGGQIRLGWNETFTRTTTVAILDYGAAGSIVWDWIASHQDIHAPLYWTVEPLVDPTADHEGAIVRLEQGPFLLDNESLIAMAEEAQFWAWHLCNLRSVLEAKHDMRKHRPL